MTITMMKRGWHPIDVWVQLHDALPGVGGVDNMVGPKTRAKKAMAYWDPYGVDQVKILEATWDNLTVEGVRYFSVWGNEDRTRLLATGGMNDTPPRGFSSDGGSFTLHG